MISGKAAMAAPTRHRWVRGAGYLYLGELVVPPNADKTRVDKCDPPATAMDNSEHRLQSPNNGKVLVFRWNAGAKAWVRMGGNRLGWSPTYLSQNGWTYVGVGQGE